VYTGRIMLKSIMRGREDKIKKILLLTNFTDNKSFEKALLQHHYQVVGYVSSKVVDYRVVPVLRNVSDIRNFIANNQVDEIFVDIDAYSDYIEAARYFKLLGIPTT
ncbi:TPA: sugar transferase, partial [Streptococcus agalactiae]